MTRFVRIALRRLTLVALIAVVSAVSASFVAGTPDSVVEDASSVSGASDGRGDEQSASRGAPRSDETAQQIADAAEGDLVAPADESDPTTTTSTTVPETTTTTQAPSTTAEAPATSTTEAPKPPATDAPKPPTSSGNREAGKASYYSHKPGGCAHKTIPKGTTVTVTNSATGKSATCVVNDRGPFVAGRIIDLDITVFRQLASTSAGVFTASISW